MSNRKGVELKLGEVTYGHDTSKQKDFEQTMISIITHYLQYKQQKQTH